MLGMHRVSSYRRAFLTPNTRSSVVEKVLLRAHEEGKSFSVYVVDSRPMLEGSA